MSSRMEFLFHGQRVVVQDIEEDFQRENEYLQHLIYINANDRTLTRQEKIVRRLRDLMNRTPSDRKRTLEPSI